MALKDIKACNAARRRFVLVVDTSGRNLRFLSTLLRRFDYQVCTARTAAEALEVAAVVSPVLIMTCRKLDGQYTALGLIRAYKRANPRSAVPMIVLTARPDPAFERACLAAGALVCLRSPVPLEDFYRVIQVAVEPVPRMNIRITADLPAAIGEEAGYDRVRAISEHGAYLQTGARFPLKTRVPVRFRLDGRVVSAEGVVIYAHAAGAGHASRPGLGLQFVAISPQDRNRIRRFIRSEMARGISPLPAGR
jgi:CheY-like chemotaxis protein